MPRAALTDAELIERIATADREAMAELHRRHHAWLTVRLRYRCNNYDIVDEVVQDTFVTVWQRAAVRYRGEGEVGAWLWGIAIHRLMNSVRPRRSLIERIGALRFETTTMSAEDALLANVNSTALWPAMSQLSPELRAVVQATVLDGLTCREAGQLLGIPSGTVKTRLMRARRELREALV